jgi:hypothetical protein
MQTEQRLRRGDWDQNPELKTTGLSTTRIFQGNQGSQGSPSDESSWHGQAFSSRSIVLENKKAMGHPKPHIWTRSITGQYEGGS